MECSSGGFGVPASSSMNGAQSLSLQSFLQANNAELIDDTESLPNSNTTVFSCLPCNRSFNTHRGLQIHLRSHNKLTSTINKNVSERCRNALQAKQTQDHQIQNVLDNNYVEPGDDVDEAFDEIRLPEAIPNDLKCPVCGFIAKNKGGLKLHMKIHISSRQDENIAVINDNNNELHEIISFYRLNTRLLNQIPKEARASAADKLSKIIDTCIAKNDIVSWRKLFLFSYTSLCVPDRDNKTSLTSAVKQNILNSHSIQIQSSNHEKKDKPKCNLSKRIESKVADCDIKNAMRLLTSEDTIAPMNDETFNALIAKHPQPSRVLELPERSTDIIPVCVDNPAIITSIENFKKGSAAGLDGIKPQFLKDMLAKQCGESSVRLLKSITSLTNFMLAGKLCTEICKYMYGAVLIAFKKKDGGIRPIAVGNTFRRLSAKIACSMVGNSMADYLSPQQVGCSVKGGCEAAVHSARKFISTITSPRKVMMKVDVENAFNKLERDKMLSSVKNNSPQIFPFMWQAYSEPSLLLFGNKIIESSVGCQQGDPLGPLGFSLSIHPIVEKLISEFNVFYLDDGTIGGDFDTVLDDFKFFIKECKKLGLSVNDSKCELFIPFDEHKNEIIAAFQEVAPNIKIVSETDLTLLGSPLTENAANQVLTSKINMFKLFSNRLKSINHHVALFLLKNCLAIPLMTYLLRSAPLFNNSLLNELDDILKKSLEFFLNTKLDDNAWNQASLPIRNGGIGIRKLTDVSISAYCSSLYSTNDLAFSIFSASVLTNNIQLELAKNIWKNRTNMTELPLIPSLQKNWDSPLITKIFSDLPKENLIDQARLLAVSEKESGDWLNAVPSPNLGTLLDPESLRIAVSLRLGTKIYRSHVCKCGQMADEYGRHGLSCRKAAGTIPRHFSLNDLLKRALQTAEIPSRLEPLDISRDNNSKRVDGVTITPWSYGRQLAWDAICVDPLCASYVHGSARKACFAAERAVVIKRNDYSSVCNLYHFVAFAVDCLGGWSNEAKMFSLELGKKMRQCTGESRSLLFFRQRISLAIQRGNAASVLGTIPSEMALNEVFYLS